LLQKIGVEGIRDQVRRQKDMGSPLRKMTPEEQKIFKG
jgi:ClpP class serine protease